MKTFSEITEAKEDSSRKPFRLVVLADRPKTIKENASSTKLIKARRQDWTYTIVVLTVLLLCVTKTQEK